MSELTPKKGVRITPIILVLVLFIFLFFVKFPDESTTISYQFYQVLFHPVQRFSKFMAGGLTGAWTHYLYLIDTEKENQVLRQQIQEYGGMKVQVADLSKEVEQLRGLLNLKPKLPVQLHAAEVIALDMSVERSAFWINSGTQNGITEAQPVIDHQGVVGQVYQAYPSRSLVLTLHDPLFRLHVINVRTNERAVLTGQNQNGLILLRYLHRETQVQEGDVFITSGLGGAFPHGIGVGTVVKINRPKTELESQVWIKPLVDVSRVQQVFTVVYSVP